MINFERRSASCGSSPRPTSMRTFRPIKSGVRNKIDAHDLTLNIIALSKCSQEVPPQKAAGGYVQQKLPGPLEWDGGSFFLTPSIFQ